MGAVRTRTYVATEIQVLLSTRGLRAAALSTTKERQNRNREIIAASYS